MKPPKLTAFVTNTKNAPKKALFLFLTSKSRVYNRTVTELFSDKVYKFLRVYEGDIFSKESLIISKSIQGCILNKQISKLSYTHLHPHTISRGGNESNKILDYGFVDLRQLTVIHYKNSNMYISDDTKLFGFNFFNFRTYN